MKKVPQHVSSEKHQLQPPWDTTAHVWQWPQSRVSKTPNAGENTKQQECSFIAAAIIQQ